jgi:hypothetical protein
VGRKFIEQDTEQANYQKQEDDREQAIEDADEIDDDDSAVDDATPEDAGTADNKPKKAGLIARLFAPVPPDSVPEQLQGSTRAPVDDKPSTPYNDDVVNMSAEDEEYLFATQDKDADGEDFLGAPSGKTMQDLTGMPRESSITGFTTKDREALLSTEQRDENGEDFLGAPSQKEVDDVVDIPREDDDFLFGTGINDNRKQKISRTRYQISNKVSKNKRKSKEQQDADTDEFLFGIKGAF